MDEAVLRCFICVASRWHLRYLVVFGSRAKGYAGPHSDYDVAVKVGRDLSLVERGLLQMELEECVDVGLDLLVVDDWDPIAVWEALAHGKLVYYCGPQCLAEYYEDLVRAIDEVADLEPIIKLFREEMGRALARSNS